MVGTGVNITLTILAAYPLSRRELLGKNVFITMMVLTVYLSGGLIPFYRLVKEIGLFNSRWALVLPTARLVPVHHHPAHLLQVAARRA